MKKLLSYIFPIIFVCNLGFASYLDIFIPFLENKGQVHKAIKFYIKLPYGFIGINKDGSIIYILNGKNGKSYVFYEIFENKATRMAPLFWLHNVKQMSFQWPIEKTGKGQFIEINEKSKPLLIPNKNYIFLRRFSSKDDKNRLIAAPYFCNFIKSDYIGVENKLNYIYRPGGYLERNEIIGLCALLNSSLFDTYFRIFNGNVNVSATELRGISFPPLETIREIGDTIILSNNFSVENANSVVNQYFEPVYSL